MQGIPVPEPLLYCDRISVALVHRYLVAEHDIHHFLRSAL